MTNQEAFEKMARHLLTQKQKSLKPRWDGAMICAYRGENGLKCAVGVLIPDRMYRPDFEGMRASFLAHKYPEILEGVWAQTLDHMQRIHDERLPVMWRCEIAQLGQILALNVDFLKEFDGYEDSFKS